MTEAEIREIVTETVTQTLATMGVDTAKPFELQQDMAYLRTWRKSSETIKRQSLLTAIGILTTGILGLIWMTITVGRS